MGGYRTNGQLKGFELGEGLGERNWSILGEKGRGFKRKVQRYVLN